MLLVFGDSPRHSHVADAAVAAAARARSAAGSHPSLVMWIGWLEFDLLLGDVHSLKQALGGAAHRGGLQRRFAVSAAETGSQDLHRRAGIGLAAVAGDHGHLVEVLDAAERLVARAARDRTLSARRGARPQRRPEILLAPQPCWRHGAFGQPARRHQEGGARACCAAGGRQPDDVPAALQCLPGPRLGPALLLAQRLPSWDG